MQPRPGPVTKLGLLPPEADIAEKVLLKEGVPETAIVVGGEDVTSTYEEARAIRHWADSNHINAMIIPTEVFHTRRVRWLFGKRFKGAGVQVVVRAVPAREYAINDWWRHEQGVVAFQNEVIKYLFYRIRY